MKASELMVGDILWYEPWASPVIVVSIIDDEDGTTHGHCFIHPTNCERNRDKETIFVFNVKLTEGQLRPMAINSKFLADNISTFNVLIANYDLKEFAGRILTRDKDEMVTFRYEPGRFDSMSVNVDTPRFFGKFTLNYIHELQHIMRMADIEIKFNV